MMHDRRSSDSCNKYNIEKPNLLVVDINLNSLRIPIRRDEALHSVDVYNEQLMSFSCLYLFREMMRAYQLTCKFTDLMRKVMLRSFKFLSNDIILNVSFLYHRLTIATEPKPKY
ncbi:CLUMA_CG020140, isoform A [Clunio marinus]|uniref:CLUMA_CG020140, isoform A n=1 Tax=Clunio marinus TaxID=568069 RepID=A0A1J1J3Y9_9DIPT|nr:CLUMA_CG020140, isoform A [Clunio marinus]